MSTVDAMMVSRKCQVDLTITTGGNAMFKITTHKDYTLSIRMDRDTARTVRAALVDAEAAQQGRSTNLPVWWTQSFDSREDAVAYFREDAEAVGALYRLLNDALER